MLYVNAVPGQLYPNYALTINENTGSIYVGGHKNADPNQMLMKINWVQRIHQEKTCHQLVDARL